MRDRMHRTRWGVGLLALSSFAACTMAPKYQRPEAPVPQQFPNSEGGEQDVLSYEQFFREPRLLRLIALALEENRDLRIAKLNVEELRAQYRIQRAALAPRIDGVVGRNQTRIISPLFPDRGGIEYTQYTTQVGMTAYELDFFGRIQSLKDQALEAYLASEEAQRSAELSLVASVATQYFVEQASIDLLERTKAIRETAAAALELTRRGFEVGSKSALDLRTAEGIVARFDAEIAALEQRIELARNALTLLVGKALPEDLPEPSPFNTEGVLASVRPGLPSQLLQRRPDILAAEHQLKAANANIGAARAAFFPRVLLTATGGSASADVLGLFKPGSGTWQFLPQITVPLFSMGSRFAELDVSKVRKLSQVANYERAIQTAFREVADALASLKHLTAQLEARQAEAKAVEERYTLAVRRYETGLDSYLSVLTAQQDLFAAQQALVTVQLDQRTNMINLYRALGGGFQ